MSEPKYPSSPILLQDGSCWCPQCDKEWNVAKGEKPNCKPCADAFDAMGRPKTKATEAARLLGLTRPVQGQAAGASTSAEDDVVARWRDLAFEIYCEGYDGDVPPHYPFSVGDREQRLCEKIEAAFQAEIKRR